MACEQERVRPSLPPTVVGKELSAQTHKPQTTNSYPINRGKLQNPRVLALAHTLCAPALWLSILNLYQPIIESLALNHIFPTLNA